MQTIREFYFPQSYKPNGGYVLLCLKGLSFILFYFILKFDSYNKKKKRFKYLDICMRNIRKYQLIKLQDFWQFRKLINVSNIDNW